MQYFAYSPIDMSAEHAYEQAKPFLRDNHIVVVASHSRPQLLTVMRGARPSALPNTYLVRVEQDGSLRTVQKALK